MINKKYPSHRNKLALFSIFVLFLSSSISMAEPQNKSTTSVNVGVVLHDLNHSVSGKIWLSCIEMALSDFYISRPEYNTRLVLKIREYKQNNVLGAANAALDLIKNEQVKAIIGPVTSMETSFVITLGEQAHVPIISFSATSPSLTSFQSSYFFQFAQNDSLQMGAISAVSNIFGWKRVVPIYSDSMYDYGAILYLTDTLQEVGAGVPYRSIISPSATDEQIEIELYTLMTMQTTVFIVHMKPDLCSRLFVKAKELGMMSEGYVWLITNGITNGLTSMNSSVINSMIGVIGVQAYVPETTELGDFKLRWKQKFHEDYPTIIDTPEFDVFGLWAYDAAHALALAIEQVFLGTTNSSIIQNSNATNSLTDFGSSIPISPYGPKLCKALLTVTFQGMAGNFSLVDGQLQSSTFEIMNVDGREARTVGFWTPETGLERKLNSTKSDHILGPIIWPGETLNIPTGWKIRNLRVGVPVEVGFNEFVKVTKNQSTGVMELTGFVIDVFTALMVQALPYGVSYEFVPLMDGSAVGNYSNIVNQVALGNFDVAVGGITVIADYSSYVDFTVPYAASGIVMVLPVQYIIRSKNTWAFLKPWKWNLWLVMAGFFLFIGFAVWVLEHRVNEDFRGPPSHQFGFGLWFSFSTMVSSQNATIVSNLTRFVVGIWMFVVIVLTISYTASLTSIYTVQKLQPTITDLKGVLRNGGQVGYLNNVYVLGLLQQTGFDKSMLRSFRTLEAVDEAFSNGGLSAVVDEIPNMKLFIAKYCNKYMMTAPIFQTNGFAFVFEKQSPILPAISQGIQTLTEEGKINNLENKWFKTESKCQDWSTPKDYSDNLGLDSFWILFLTAGLASTLALIIFVASFIYKHRHIFKQPADSRLSTWTKIQTMIKIFNEKDPNCHAFKCSQPPSEVEASVNNPQSPISDNLSHADSHSAFSGEQHTASTDQASPEITPAATDVVVTIVQTSIPSTAQGNN